MRARSRSGRPPGGGLPHPPPCHAPSRPAPVPVPASPRCRAEYSAGSKLLSEKQAEIGALERAKGGLPSAVEAAKVKEDAVLAQLQATKAGE